MKKKSPKKVTSGKRIISMNDKLRVKVPYPIDQYSVTIDYVGGDNQKPVKETYTFNAILN